MNIHCLQTDPSVCEPAIIQSQCMNLFVSEMRERYGENFDEKQYLASLKQTNVYTDFTRFWVAWDGTKIIWTAWLIIDDTQTSLTKMFVCHEHRAQEKLTNTEQHQKLSHKLLHEVFTYCEQNNILSLSLQTSNIHAVRFYEKNGFVLLDPIPQTWSSYRCVRMEKQL